MRLDFRGPMTTFDKRPELVPVAAFLCLGNALLHLGDGVVKFADHCLETGLTP